MTYRNRAFTIASASLALLVMAFAVVLSLAEDTPPWAVPPIASVSAALGYLAWQIYGAPRVELAHQEILVINPFRVHRIPYDSVERVSAGRYLVLYLRDGSMVKAWSVQAANISLMLGRPSHVDRVATEIANEINIAHRAHAGFGGADSPVDVVERSPITSRTAWLVAVWVLHSWRCGSRCCDHRPDYLATCP